MALGKSGKGGANPKQGKGAQTSKGNSVGDIDEDDVANASITTLKGGLMIQDITLGTGAPADNGKTVIFYLMIVLLRCQF